MRQIATLSAWAGAGLIWLTLTSGMEGTVQLPGNVDVTVRKLMEIMDKTCTEEKRLGKNGREFRATLDRLAEEVAPRLAMQMKSLESENIRAKLITIAEDKHKRRKLYEEIRLKYVNHHYWRPKRSWFRRERQLFTPFPISPELYREHMREKYRLAWEYFLLKPNENGVFKYDCRAMEALEAIGNPASIVTLTHCFRTTYAQGVRDDRVFVCADIDVATRRQWLLIALGSFHNTRGLCALLQCVSLSRHTRGTQQHGQQRFDPKVFVVHLLAVEKNWGAIVEDLPIKNLPAEQREVLKQVREYYKMNKRDGHPTATTRSFNGRVTRKGGARRVTTSRREIGAGPTQVISRATQVVSRVTPVVGRPTPVISRATQVVSRATPVVGRATQVVGRATPVVGRVTQVVGRVTQVVSRATQVVGRATQIVSRATQVVGRATKLAFSC